MHTDHPISSQLYMFQVNKFEQVSSDDHQMSLTGGWALSD